MYIFLGIVGELATIIGSVAIILNCAFDSVLEISKKGYKFDKTVMDEIQKKNNGVKKILSVILLLVPGVNLINASIKSVKLKKIIINNPQVKQAIVPMTEKEKEQYAKMETKMQKLAFITFAIENKNEEKEFFGFVGKRPIVVDRGLTSLHYEELIPLAYTLDEIKRLNDATTYSYRIGKIEDRNVAIIGIPNPDSLVSRVRLKKEKYNITHAYEKMTEEDAQGKTFVVYPFTTHYEETVQKVIDEIKQSRIDNAVKANLEVLQVQPTFKQDGILETKEKGLTKDQQGPILKRTLNPKIK